MIKVIWENCLLAQELLRKHGLLEVGTPSPFVKRRLSMCSPQRRPRRPPKIVIYGADAAFLDCVSPMPPAPSPSLLSPKTPRIPLTPAVKKLCDPAAGTRRVFSFFLINITDDQTFVFHFYSHSLRSAMTPVAEMLWKKRALQEAVPTSHQKSSKPPSKMVRFNATLTLLGPRAPEEVTRLRFNSTYAGTTPCAARATKDFRGRVKRRAGKALGGIAALPDRPRWRF